MAVEKPIGQYGTRNETRFTEKLERGFIVGSDEGIELVKMKTLSGIPHHLGNGCLGISLMAPRSHHHDADFSTLMLWFEVYQVHDANGLPFSVFNHQPQLPVGIDIGGLRGYIVMERIAGIGNVGSTHVPKFTVVLYLIEDIEVLRFYRSQAYILVVHLITSLPVMMVAFSG